MGLLLGLTGVALSKRRAFFGQTVALLGCLVAVVSALWHVVDMRVYATNSDLAEKRYAVLEYTELSKRLMKLEPPPKCVTYLWSGTDDIGERVLRRALPSAVKFTSRQIVGDKQEIFFKNLQSVVLESANDGVLVLALELPEDRSWKDCMNMMAGRDFVLVNPPRIDQLGCTELFALCNKENRENNGQLLMVINRKDDVKYDSRKFLSYKKDIFNQRFWVQKAK